ncbi:MAG: TolB family protein, partial [Candidatus Binatia bacterium]
SNPVLSPNGGKIYFRRAVGATYQLFSINTDGTGLHQITNLATGQYWLGQPNMIREGLDISPDGQELIFAGRKGEFGDGYVFRLPATASMAGDSQLIGPVSTINQTSGSPAYRNDGQKIVMNGAMPPPPAIGGVIVSNLDGSGKNLVWPNISPSSLSFSPNNSRIAWEDYRNAAFGAYTANADGTGSPQQVSPNCGNWGNADWAPDGTIYVDFYNLGDGECIGPTDPTDVATQLYVVNRDGTNRRRVTNVRFPPSGRSDVGIAPEGPPAISPDGSTVAVSIWIDGHPTDSGAQIYMFSSGASDLPVTGLQQVTQPAPGGPRWDHHGWPSYSADGTKLLHNGLLHNAANLALSQPRLMTVNADGSNESLVYELVWDGTSSELLNINPQYSPNGAKIGYVWYYDPPAAGLFEVSADGSNNRLLTDGETVPADWATEEEALATAFPEVQEADADANTEIAAYDAKLRCDGSSGDVGCSGLLGANPGEIKWCQDHAFTCVRFFKDQAVATDVMEYLYGIRRGHDDTMANAFLHTFWLALMVNSQGEDPTPGPNCVNGFPCKDAMRLAKRHENRAYSLDRNTRERRKSRMDMTNNRVGYGWAVREEGNDDQRACVVTSGRAANARYIGRQIDPYRWIKDHNYDYFRPIYRRKWTLINSKRVVVDPIAGRTCAGAPIPED